MNSRATSSQEGSGLENPPAPAGLDRGESLKAATGNRGSLLPSGAVEGIRPRCLVDGSWKECAVREIVGAHFFDTYRCDTCGRVDRI